jgi:uncharacterized protein (UPF0548 family)
MAKGQFSLNRPAIDQVMQQVAAVEQLAIRFPSLLSVNGEINLANLPFGFAHDSLHSLLGRGERAFSAAKHGFKDWAMFDIGWVRVVNTEALIAADQIVAVEAHTLGLWTLNLSRIVETVDSTDRFGFVYTTTKMHVEQGTERFLLEFDCKTGDVWYRLDALSRPGHILARLGYPVTRAYQHKFARDSHRRMREKVLKDESAV